MYSTILALHSLLRWAVLLSLLYTIFRSYAGWLGNKTWVKQDSTMRMVTTTLLHVQLIIGVWLYFVSPLIDYFRQNFKTAVHERGIRFFGMEHNIMMVVAIILVTIGSAMAKRKPTDKAKFKTLAIWCTIGLIIILASIPWPFSPMTARPYFRGF